MQVTTWKTVEVECECEVSAEDMIGEFSQRVDESAADYWRRMLPAVDCMTRILAKITDETIATVPREARETVSARLEIQANRWRVASEEQENKKAVDSLNGR